MKIFTVPFDHIVKRAKLANPLAEEVIVAEHHIRPPVHILSPDVVSAARMEGFAFVLCRQGELLVDVNYKPLRLSQGSLLILGPMHLFGNVRVERHCEVLVLVMSRTLLLSFNQNALFAKKMIDTFDQRVRAIPILQLDEREANTLADVMLRVQANQKRTDHIFQGQLLKNEACNFIMECAHTILKRLGAESQNEVRESRHDEIMREFVKLVAQHFRQQREVAFYANKLNITPDTLSRNVIFASNQSPLQWINHIVISEAKTLLLTPNSTIKQVAEELNFSDQASFAKFFKRHAGITAVEYRKNV